MTNQGKVKAVVLAGSSVLWGMLYCTAIKVISDIAYK